VARRGVPRPGRNDATGTFNGPITLIKGGTGESLAAAPRAGADGGSRTFTMQMTFTVRENTPGFNEADFQCGHQRADGKPSGLVNTIAMEGDTDGDGNNHGCLSTDGKLKFSKEVTTQPGNGSTFDVVYTVSVVNEGSLSVSTGPINDKPSFAPGLNPTLVKVQREMGPTRTVNAQADGSYRLSDNETLYSGLTIRYTVTFTVKIDPSVTGYRDELLSCTTDKGRLVPGHGLYNHEPAAAINLPSAGILLFVVVTAYRRRRPEAQPVLVAAHRAGAERAGDEALAASDDAGACLVLTAPPGTGKTTLVPPLLADVLADVPADAPQRAQERRPGRVVVTQPRRIAARAAARRLADRGHRVLVYSRNPDASTPLPRPHPRTTPALLYVNP